MNVRDRLVPHEDEDSYIRFDINEGNADCEVSCTDKELASWLANIIKIWVKLIHDNFEEETQKQIVGKWVKDLKRLLLNDEEW